MFSKPDEVIWSCIVSVRTYDGTVLLNAHCTLATASKVIRYGAL